MISCTQCNTPMTSDSPEALCARCLLSAAMKDQHVQSRPASAASSRFYWAVSQFPELDHLDPVQKAQVLATIPWGTYPTLILRACIATTLLAGIPSLLLFGLLADSQLAWIAFILVGAVVWMAVYLVQLGYLRRVMRGEIAKAFRGEKPPFCFSCGYDLRGATGAICPECGNATGASGVRKNGVTAIP